MQDQLAKLDGDGQPVFRQDGKVLKSDRFEEPDLASILNHQFPGDSSS